MPMGKFRQERRRLRIDRAEVLLEKVRRKEGIRKWFESLDAFSHSPKVRLFDFEGTPVVIKDTKGAEKEGYSFHKFRETIRKHHRAQRGGKIRTTRYILKPPRVYGRIGPYLLMEFMDGKSAYEIDCKKGVFEEFCNKKGLKPTEETMNSLKEAIAEMESNFHWLEAHEELPQIPLTGGNFPAIPQYGDWVILGNTNPKSPADGKWIIAPTYDLT